MSRYFVINEQGNRVELEIKRDAIPDEVRVEAQAMRGPINAWLIVGGVAGWAIAIGMAIADLLGG